MFKLCIHTHRLHTYLKVMTRLGKNAFLIHTIRVLHLLVSREDIAETLVQPQTSEPDLNPEINLLCQEVIKCLSVSSGQLRGQHDPNEGPGSVGQGVREHVDPRSRQQHWGV